MVKCAVTTDGQELIVRSTGYKIMGKTVWYSTITKKYYWLYREHSIYKLKEVNLTL